MTDELHAAAAWLLSGVTQDPLVPWGALESPQSQDGRSDFAEARGVRAALPRARGLLPTCSARFDSGTVFPGAGADGGHNRGHLKQQGLKFMQFWSLKSDINTAGSKSRSGRAVPL